MSAIKETDDDARKSYKLERMLFFQQKRNEELESSLEELKQQLEYVKSTLVKTQATEQELLRLKAEIAHHNVAGIVPGSTSEKRASLPPTSSAATLSSNSLRFAGVADSSASPDSSSTSLRSSSEKRLRRSSSYGGKGKISRGKEKLKDSKDKDSSKESEKDKEREKRRERRVSRGKSTGASLSTSTSSTSMKSGHVRGLSSGSSPATSSEVAKAEPKEAPSTSEAPVSSSSTESNGEPAAHERERRHSSSKKSIRKSRSEMSLPNRSHGNGAESGGEESVRSSGTKHRRRPRAGDREQDTSDHTDTDNESELKRLKDALEEEKQRTRELADQNKEIKEKFTDLSTELEALKESFQATKSTLEVVNLTLQAEQIARAQAEAEAEAAREAEQQAKKSFDLLENNLRGIRESRDKTATSADELEDAKSQVLLLKQQLEQEKITNTAQISALNAEIDGLKKTLEMYLAVPSTPRGGGAAGGVGVTAPPDDTAFGNVKYLKNLHLAVIKQKEAEAEVLRKKRLEFHAHANVQASTSGKFRLAHASSSTEMGNSVSPRPDRTVSPRPSVSPRQGQVSPSPSTESVNHAAASSKPAMTTES